MGEAVLEKQLMIRIDNKVGTLAEVTSVISSSGINMVAICAYAIDNEGFVMFITEDNNAAKKLLEQKKMDVREEEVILLTIENKPGALQDITEKIADAGIDLTLIYGSVEKSGKDSRVVLISENNLDAMVLLKTLIDRS